MALNLVKAGEKLDLTKTNPELNVLAIGLGWDKGTANFDLDAYCVAVDDAKSAAAFDDKFICFFNSNKLTDESKAAAHGTLALDFFKKAQTKNYSVREIFDSAVIHYGDNRDGEGDGDDEVLTINLNAIPNNVTKLVIGVNIFEAKASDNFGQVRNAFVRVFNTNTGEEKLRYDLSEDFSVFQGMNVAEIYRNNGEWKFNALNPATNGYSGTLEAALPLACQ